MTTKIQLRDAIDLYLIEVKSELSYASLRTKRSILNVLHHHVGDIQFPSLTPIHVSKVINALDGRDISNGTFNNYVRCIKTFIEWAHVYDYVSPSAYPKLIRLLNKNRPYQPKPKTRVLASDFPALLEAAESHHPRDRILIAFGLYLMIRVQAEGTLLKLRDLNLKDWTVNLRRAKKKTYALDEVQCCLELEAELKYWFEFYKKQTGFVGSNTDFAATNPEWYLVPALRSYPRERDSRGSFTLSIESDHSLMPETKIVHANIIARRALGAINVPLYDDDGKSTYEAMHTLRRSAARAFFDERREPDGSNDVDILMTLMTWLGHADLKTTMIYIGYDAERLRRNRQIKGQYMYRSTLNPLVNQVLGENVVPLRKEMS